MGEPNYNTTTMPSDETLEGLGLELDMSLVPNVDDLISDDFDIGRLVGPKTKTILDRTEESKDYQASRKIDAILNQSGIVDPGQVRVGKFRLMGQSRSKSYSELLANIQGKYAEASGDDFTYDEYNADGGTMRREKFDDLYGVSVADPSEWVSPRERRIIAANATADMEGRPSFIPRTAQQFLNTLVLGTIERQRPTTKEAIAQPERAVDMRIAYSWDVTEQELADAPEYVKNIIIAGGPQTPTDYAELSYYKKDVWDRRQANAYQRLRAERFMRGDLPDWMFDVPQAKTIAEKVSDVAGGLSAFLLKLWIAKRIVSKLPIPKFKGGATLQEALAFEVANLGTGAKPGEGALMSMLLGAMNSVKGGTLAREAGKMGLESAAFAGMAFVQGKELSDIAIAALIPPGMRGFRALRWTLSRQLFNAKTPGQVRDYIKLTWKVRVEALKVLGLGPNATNAEIREAYWKMARDMRGDAVTAKHQEIFSKATEAYQNVTGRKVVFDIGDRGETTPKGAIVLRGRPRSGTVSRKSTIVYRGKETIPSMPEGQIVPPVSHISRVTPVDAIVPRVDIATLGLVAEDEALAPAKAPIPKAPEAIPSLPKLKAQAVGMKVDIADLMKLEGVERRTAIQKRLSEAAEERPVPERGLKALTPEEELTLARTESVLEAEAPLEVKPKLYVGNFTQGMKQRAADALGVDVKHIQEPLESGYRIKRLATPLTMDQARQYLVNREEHLDWQLDNNQIRTHHDMAMANADWGDIKELRKVLGLPVGTRPFVIIEEPKTEVITIEDARERIRKAVTPSQADIVHTTQIDRLNVVMRSLARATTEGYKLGKAEQRQLYAEKRYLQKRLQMRNRLIQRIQRPSAKYINPYYRIAIEGIQSQLDFEASTETKQQAKESLRAAMESDPEKAADLSQELWRTLQKKDIRDLSYAELSQVDADVARLRMLGRLKSRKQKQYRKAQLAATTKDIIAALETAPKGLIPGNLSSLERATFLMPLRIFDRLEGGTGKYAGPLTNFFYWPVNEATNAESHNTKIRLDNAMLRLRKLGLSRKYVTRLRPIGDKKMTIDGMIAVYAGWKNPAHQAALKYGGATAYVGRREVSMPITDELYTQIEANLTEADKLWGDTLIEEYGENWSRVREATIEHQNRDPFRQINYSRMRRRGIEFKTNEEDILDEMQHRTFFRPGGPHKGFTIPREEIPPEYQKPLDTRMTAVWMNEVKAQEHYINFAGLVKDMKAVANDPKFRGIVEEKFGRAQLSAIDDYITVVANPSFYGARTDFQRVSAMFRQHRMLAYLGGRVLTSAPKQLTGVLTAYVNSDPLHATHALARLVTQSRREYARAVAIHPQISTVYVEREMEELARNPLTLHWYEGMVRSYGRPAMYAFMLFDRVTRIMITNSVYDKAISDRMGPEAAQREAVKTVLLWQESTSPKDLAQIYTRGEGFKWFTQFTRQLYQFYGLATYDIPAAVRSHRFRDAIMIAFGLSMIALMEWMIQHRQLPESAGDVAEAIGDQAVDSIPILGRAVYFEKERAKTALKRGDYVGVLKAFAEPFFVVLGLPYQAIRDITKDDKKKKKRRGRPKGE